MAYVSIASAGINKILHVWYFRVSLIFLSYLSLKSSIIIKISSSEEARWLKKIIVERRKLTVMLQLATNKYDESVCCLSW